MKGLKKTSPIEVRSNTSIYWSEKLSPHCRSFELKNIMLLKYVQALLLLKTEPKKFNKIKKMKMHINLGLIETIVKIKKFVSVLVCFRQVMLIKGLYHFNKTLAYWKINNIAFIHTGWFPVIKWGIYHHPNIGRYTRILSRTSWEYYNLWLEVLVIFRIPWLKIKLYQSKFAWNMIINLNSGLHTLNFSKFIINCKKAIESTLKHASVIQTIVYILSFFFQTKRHLFGYQFHAIGTIGHHGRAKMETFRDGKLSLSTISKKFGYDNIQSITKFGNVGIKFWCEIMTSQVKPAKFL